MSKPLKPFNQRYHVSRAARDVAWGNFRNAAAGDHNADYESLTEAFQSADMNFGVERRDLFFRDGQGNFVPFPKKQALVRVPTDDDPNEAPMSIVTKKYQPFQNSDFAKTFDIFSRDERTPIAAFGSLQEGLHTFAMFQLEQVQFGVETHNQFLLIFNTHRPGTSVRIGFITVRTWCTNQFMRLMNSGFSLKLHHNLQLQDRIEVVSETLQTVGDYSNRTFETYERMQHTPMHYGTQVSIFKMLAEKIHPTNATLSTRVTDDLNNVYDQEGDDGTMYGVWQSITAYANHLKGKMVQQQLMIPGSSRNNFMREGWKIVNENVEK